jgi:hypothetical protein
VRSGFDRDLQSLGEAVSVAFFYAASIPQDCQIRARDHPLKIIGSATEGIKECWSGGTQAEELVLLHAFV